MAVRGSRQPSSRTLNGRRARQFRLPWFMIESWGFTGWRWFPAPRRATFPKIRWLARWRKEIGDGIGSVGLVCSGARFPGSAQFASQVTRRSAAVPFHRAPVIEAIAARRRRAADERALAGRASPFAVCPMRGRSGRPSRARAALRDSIRIPSTLLSYCRIPRCPPEGPSKVRQRFIPEARPTGLRQASATRFADGDGGNQGRQSQVRR